MKPENILSIKDLAMSFDIGHKRVNVIKNMNFDIERGETVAIVGESGSGKSVTVKAIMHILSNNQFVDSGSIMFTYQDDHHKQQTVDIIAKSEKEVRGTICGKHIAMVFQDPMTSLNPTVIVGKQIMEGMLDHYDISKKEAKEKVIELLTQVGFEEPEKWFKRYPHQLSGGMRQRIVLAIALACDPDILICDEPTTALDVTIQWKILELIKKIQKEKNLTVIYITHDLGVVAKVADYVYVMYAGKMVEQGLIEDVFYDPRHPYTWGLLSSMPDLSTNSEKLLAIPGNPANLLQKGKGDAFAPRNPYALEIDFEEEPPLFHVGGRHYVASWLCHPDAPKVAMPEYLRLKIEKMKSERV